MPLRRLRWLIFIVLAAPVPAFAAKPKPCVTAEEASRLLNIDVCVSAHV